MNRGTDTQILFMKNIAYLLHLYWKPVPLYPSTNSPFGCKNFQHETSLTKDPMSRYGAPLDFVHVLV